MDVVTTGVYQLYTRCKCCRGGVFNFDFLTRFLMLSDATSTSFIDIHILLPDILEQLGQLEQMFGESLLFLLYSPVKCSCYWKYEV